MRPLPRALLAVTLLAAAAALIVLGLRVRTAVWRASSAARFRGDIANACHQADEVLNLGRELAGTPKTPTADLTWREFFRGYVARYERVQVELDAGRETDLDYPPGRLLLVSTWAWHVRQSGRELDPNDDDIFLPLLDVNTGCELASAAGAFALVGLWLRRSGRSVELSATLGLASAALLWMDPALLLDAHLWPQWDVWLVPFFLWAAVAASFERWFVAGMLLALGAMFKGQLLIVAPLFPLWALLAGRYAGAAAVASGFLAAALAVGSPWLVPPTAAAWTWVAFAVVAAAVLVLLPAVLQRSGFWWVPALAAAAVLIGTAYRVGGPLLPAILLAAAVLALPFLRGRRSIWPWLIGTYGGAAAAAAGVFGGSWAWLTAGFVTGRYFTLSRGGAFNLPALLAAGGWTLTDPTVPIPLPFFPDAAVEMRTLLLVLFYATLLGCAAGLSLHGRRRDPRWLVALAAPWVLMFALMPQMHERYLLWAAVVTAVPAVLSPGLLLLHLSVTALAASQMWSTLSAASRLQSVAPHWTAVIESARPHAAWGLLVIAGVYLYLAMMPRGASVGGAIEGAANGPAR